MIDYDDDDSIDVNYEKLSRYLKEIASLQGMMKWTHSAKVAYNNWFYPYREADVDDKTGTFDRLNDHVIKVAVCISIARKKNMVIEEEDVEEAITLCSTLSNTARKVAGMQGTSSIATIIKSFLMIMLGAEAYSLSRTKALQKGFGDFDAAELDKCIETLSQTGFIVQTGGGKDIKYKLTKQCIEWWEKNQKES